jgi:cytochrome c peroxidase
MPKAVFTIFLISAVIILLVSFTKQEKEKSLRDIYSRPPAQWPKPNVDSSVQWTELGVLPPSPFANVDSLKQLQSLGAILFFDPRLSGSGKISCASCHDPALSWTDGRKVSSGHEGASTHRNSPTIQNVWFYEKLFWDGRSASLEDQAFSPINSETEMHGDMPGLSRRLKKFAGYAPLFESAFGDPGIDPDRITQALAAFQRTITSSESRFDKFLKGDKYALSNQELRGLHIFRTEANCMNCHNSPMFSDNRFHNNGFANGDVGRFFVTHREEDKGKMKTPSLRDVIHTGPWMHDGAMGDLGTIISIYGKGRPQALLGGFSTSKTQLPDLLAFLQSISAPPKPFNRPQLPY